MSAKVRRQYRQANAQAWPLVTGRKLPGGLARLPGDPDVLTYIAFAHRRQNNEAAAEAAYRAALTTNPNHPGALAYQGSLFLKQGRRAEAEANLARLSASCGSCEERETLARELAAR